MYTKKRIKEFKNIAVIANDLGGAEHLLSFVEKSKLFKEKKISFFFNGPSTELINNKKNSIFENISRDQLDRFDLIVSSTSTGDFEKKIFVQAKQLNKEIWVILDHWTDYEVRFKYMGNLYLPNLLIVTDDYAFEICKKKFPFTNIEKVENYYLNNIKIKIRRKKELSNILYFSEPELTVNERYEENTNINFLTTNEWKIFQTNCLINEIKYILDSKLFKNTESCFLKVRLHPKLINTFDNKFRFINLIDKKNLKLVDALSNTDICIGKSSYALYISNYIGIPTFSIAKNLYGKNRQFLPINLDELI